MKIRTFTKIENNVRIVTKQTEDWSEQDQVLISKFGEPEIDLGGTFTISAVSGSHTGLDDASDLEDTAKAFNTDALVGRVITNNTDGSLGTITANTDTTVTAALAGGDNDWDNGDTYTIASKDFTLSSDLVRIMTQSPFVIRIDIRDYDDAEERASAWSAEIDSRITAAVVALRANTDDFTGETVITLEV